MSKLVSVICPTYNCEPFVAETIKSVLSQSYLDLELIIVDDCSSDGTIEIVKDFAQKDKRIRFTMLKANMGAAVARNKAIAMSEGRYIAFLDSDDKWLPEKLERQLDFMQRRDAALSHTGYYWIDEETSERIKRIHVPEKVDYPSLLKQNVIGCLTAMYDTKKLGKVYMPDLRKRQDYALWLKILKLTPYAYGLDEPLAEYRLRSDRLRSGSISSNKLKASLYNWRLYREVENLPLHKALYYFGCYTFNSLKKYS